MENNDYYRLLELTQQASPEEIKQSYRKLARKFHPDVSDDPQSEQKFKMIQEAYEILSDPQSRLAYNRDRTVLKPYTYVWLRAKLSEQLRLVAQFQAKMNAQNRVNAEFHVKKNTETYTPPSPMNIIPKRPSKKWLMLASGLIFVILVIIATSMVLTRVEGWRTDQKLMVAVLKNDETGVKNLESSDLATQSRILQYDGVKKALVNFYLAHPTDKDILSRLSAFDPSLQKELFADDDVQSLLLAHYRGQVEQAVAEDRFADAVKVLERLQEKLKESKRLAEQFDELHKQKTRRLSSLTQQYMACLEDAQAPLLGRTHCMAEARAKIEQVGVEHTLPTDTNLPTLYAEAIEQSLDTKNYAQVETLLADWEKLLPESSEQRDKFRESLNQHRQMDTLVASLVSQEKTKVLKALNQVSQLDEAMQKEVFNLPQVQQSVLVYHLEEALKLWKKREGGATTSTEGRTFTTEDLQKLVAEARQQSAALPILPIPTQTQGTPTPAKEASTSTKEVLPLATDTEKKPSPVPVTTDQVTNLLQECQAHYDANRLGTGDSSNSNTAWACYQGVLQIAPDNRDAQIGLSTIEGRYQRRANAALQNNQLNKAKGYIATLERLNPRSKWLPQLRQNLKAALNRPKPEARSEERPPEERNREERNNKKEERNKPVVEEEVTPEIKPPKVIEREIIKPPPVKKPVTEPKSPSPAAGCSELLRQLSIGVNPLTPEQQAYFQTQCR